MDCRGSLLVLFGAGLLIGCNRGQTTTSGAGPAPTPPVISQAPKEKAEKQIAKRNPTPDTCVAFGQLRLSMIGEPERSQSEKDQLYNEARQAFQKALTLDAKHVGALRGLTQVYTGVGEHDRAVATYKKLLELTPRDAGLWMELGMCHSRAKEWQPALDAMYKGLQVDPENRQHGHLYGYALARAGATDQALSVFTKLDGPAKAHYNLARMMAHLNNLEESRKHLHIALQKEPDFHPARDLLSKLDAPAAPVKTVSFESPEESAAKEQ